MTLEDYLRERYTDRTARAYKREIGNYLSACPCAATHTSADITRHMGALRGRYASASTLNRILASIKAYHAYLCFIGARDGDPARNIKLRDKRARDVQLQDLFTTEELDALLTAKKERYGQLAERNKVLISLLVCQALKPDEMERLECGEIDLVEATVHIRPSPKSEGRTLGLKAGQIMLFKAYMEEVRPKLLKGEESGAFLIGARQEPMSAGDIGKHVKRCYGKMYAPRKVNCTTIRQSVIANLLKLNHDTRLVQVFAGHRDASTTERYQQSNVEALQTALQTFHPFK